MAKLWCPGMVVYPLWWNDAIAGSCRLSTSHDQDSTWFGCEAEGEWDVRDHLDLWVGICADSCESATCGFLVGVIAQNLGVISLFSRRDILWR